MYSVGGRWALFRLPRSYPASRITDCDQLDKDSGHVLWAQERRGLPDLC